MGVPMLNQCCCGCTLKTGSTIIAVFNIIGGIYFLATGIVLCSYESKTDETNALVIAGAILATVGVLVLLAGLTLFIGAMKEIPVLLIPYMVLAMLSAAANLITSSIAASNLYEQGLSGQGTQQIIALIIYLLLQAYFILVVYSLYRQQKGTVPSTNP